MQVPSAIPYGQLRLQGLMSGNCVSSQRAVLAVWRGYETRKNSVAMGSGEPPDAGWVEPGRVASIFPVRAMIPDIAERG
jgi:hypothetical protein